MEFEHTVLMDKSLSMVPHMVVAVKSTCRYVAVKG
jgi:hypothetical protein